ncbi:MAG: FAD-binding oxidoreductase, partial [Clostridiales bacterium]|nr:FAD-binding oxidoreductase [Clostridiales bacterium]
MTDRFDAIVIGGGVIGCAVTYYLSKLGQRVLLLEREDHAQGSAGATDGVVSFHTKQPGRQLELALESIRLFDGLSAELGEDIGFHGGCGGMQPVEDAVQWELLDAVVKEQRKSGVDVRMIGIDEARAIEPQLAPDLYGALYAPSGSKVEPIRLTMAFLHAAKRLGA